MANLLSSSTTEPDFFACTDPQETLLTSPMDMANPLCDELLNDAPPKPLPLSFINNPPNNGRESMLFSYDGPAPSQYNMIPPFSADESSYPPFRSPGVKTEAASEPLPLNAGGSLPTVSRSPSAEKKMIPALSSSPSPTSSSPPRSRRGSRRGSKPHDDQRERFLEKNRIAANKHRKRKKEYIQGLESRYGEQLSRKDHLKAEVSSLRAEALDLQESLFTHARCEDEPIQSYISNKIGCLYANPPVPGSNGLVGTYIF